MGQTAKGLTSQSSVPQRLTSMRSSKTRRLFKPQWFPMEPVHDDSGGTVMVGPLNDYQMPGITYTENGLLKVAILDPSTDPGKLPGSVMSDGNSGDVDQGILIGHELGHVAFEMKGVFLWSPSDTSNRSALDLENDVRKSRNPAAATRTALNK